MTGRKGLIPRPFFIFCGRNHHQTFHVMRRRLQMTRLHTDCIARGNLGRRNRYVQSARMIPYRNARRKSVHEYRKLGHGGAFRFLYSIPTTRSINIHPETPAGISAPAYKAPESGNGRAFPSCFTGARISIASSAFSIGCVTFPCLAPVLYRIIHHGQSSQGSPPRRSFAARLSTFRFPFTLNRFDRTL